MAKVERGNALVLGFSLVLGLTLFGYLLSAAVDTFRQYERTVTVKGLSEREFSADVVIWPIQFTEAGNELESVYRAVDLSSEKIQTFLLNAGVSAEEISFSAPAITDKSAQQYGSSARAEFRYAATQTVTVYSENIVVVRSLMGKLSDLGKQGIAFSGASYDARPEYLFTRLNEVKPEMVEEATREARAVAEKFAADSNSRLGKIRNASQGQFSISERDRNNPHIKKVRVVSTITYYLSD